MKIIAYGCMQEELAYLNNIEKELNIELVTVEEVLNMENIHMAKGCDAVSVLATCKTDSTMLQIFNNFGIKYVGTRCVGSNHIDITSAKDLGIRVCNASYSQHCVADYVILLMLMCIRKMPYILRKNESYNYDISGIRGKEMPNMTIGIIGTGRIGTAVAERLRGFGCKIIAHDIYQSETLKDYVEYVTLDELYANADIITFHAKANEENFHMFNDESLKSIKPGSILINAARGELVSTDTLIKGLDDGIIGAAGIDCFEDEYGMIQNNVGVDILKRKDIRLLQSYPNVVFTPHVAFYTDQAVQDMAINGIKNLLAFENSSYNPAEV